MKFVKIASILCSLIAGYFLFNLYWDTACKDGSEHQHDHAHGYDFQSAEVAVCPIVIVLIIMSVIF